MRFTSPVTAVTHWLVSLYYDEKTKNNIGYKRSNRGGGGGNWMKRNKARKIERYHEKTRIVVVPPTLVYLHAYIIHMYIHVCRHLYIYNTHTYTNGCFDVNPMWIYIRCIRLRLMNVKCQFFLIMILKNIIIF